MRKTFGKTLSILTAGISIFLTLFISCKHEFIQAPTPLQGTSLSRNASPQNVSASNGREKIYLSWQELTGAVRYYIYATDASTPREEDFVQITQTTATSIELDVNPGSTVWYKISAVDSSFSESKKSIAVRGSTLACPEITAIENSEDKDSGEISVILDWFMSNCDSSTYRSFIEYDIKYTPEGGTENIQTYRASDLEVTHLVLRNLDPHTKYDFQIVARNTSYGDTQESLLLNQETLHRLRPSAPEDLDATRGSERNKVILSFTLPEAADVYNKTDGSYTQVPLKFEIYMKEHTAESWQLKETYQPSVYKKGDEVSRDISISNEQLNGVIYDFKVKSLADIPAAINSDSNYTKILTSENSASVATGWSMKAPALYVRDYVPVMVTNENGETSYASASMSLNFIWDNFHEDSQELENIAKSKYKYWLYQQKKSFDNGAAYITSFVGEFQSISELNQYTKSFELPADNGYYKFIACIADKNTPTPDSGSSTLPSCLHSAPTANEHIVTDNTETIGGFEVTGGYKDKFHITWTESAGWNYTLTYTQNIDGVPEGITWPVDISTPGNVWDTSNVDPLGVERTYTLSAVKAGTSPMSTTMEAVASLGRPVPTFDADNPKYDSISVKWKKLEAADSYTVQFANSTSVPVTLPEDDADNANVTAVTNSLGQTFYTYTFSRDALGTYCTDATLSGKAKTITVSASSTNDNASGTVEARTMGPAEINLNSDVAKAEKQIASTWRKIQGAKGYIINRYRNSWNGSAWVKDSQTPESFYIDDESLTISGNGETIPQDQMQLSLTDGT
ncbi:MAG: fibronectin type III domain-containing protein, partial [Treponema sp.]|nr:fibronectin type III domain-containing protein [Treponema sp.]